MFRKVTGVVLALLAVMTLAATAGASRRESEVNFSSHQQAVLASYGVSGQEYKNIVIDSSLSREQALGDNVVPAGSRELHAKMKPYLRVVPVVYHGYDNRIHLGQIVVHRHVVGKTVKLFLKMFRLGFPIYSVIPQSQFGYDDQRSMAANNSSAYRPEDGSEHRTGAAFDLNPMQNPFDVTGYDPMRPIEPAGAVYNPAAKGTIVKFSAVWKAWKDESFEWGGGWGDPNAVPITDFFREGYFDYQHFQPDFSWYDDFYKYHLPAGI
jgi:peptidoglycan LD-endopeptidase CwlK